MNRALRFTLLGLAVMCPGCGGGGSAMSPETWAHSFCTTLVNLQDGLVPLERSVDEQGSRSDAGKQEFLRALRGGRAVIREAANDLKPLPPPDSDYAARTQSLVESYGYDLDNYVADLDRIERTVVRLSPEKYQQQKQERLRQLALKLVLPLSLSPFVLETVMEVPPGRLRDALNQEAACGELVTEDA